MQNTTTPATPQGPNTCDQTPYTTATCSTYPGYPRPHSPPTGYPRTRPTQTTTSSTTTPRPSNSWPPRWATQRTSNSYDTSNTPSVTRSTTQPYARITPSTPIKTLTPARPRAASPPYPILPMVCTPLNPRPHRVHQRHLWPRGRRNLGPFQDMPPVPRTRHPHKLAPNPHHRTARWMADTVPDNPTTRHHPQADGGTRGGPRGACIHCRLHSATHPRGRPQGHGSAHATNGRCQDSGTAHLPHPQIPAACGHPGPDGPGAPPQTPVLPTVRTYPARYHPARDPAHACTPLTRHNTGMARTSTTDTASTPASMRARQAPRARTPPSVHRYRQPLATPCPLCVCQRLPQTALPCKTDHWVCLGAAHRLSHCPYWGGPPAPPPRAARSPSRTPPSRQPPQLLRANHRRPPGQPGRVLCGGRSGPRVDQSHGHGERTPIPPTPASAPQRWQLEPGGPPHPSRPLPPPP